MSSTNSNVLRFRRVVLGYYRKHKRNLPWMKTTNLYRVLVSELMLQQTQVDRVIPYYTRFIKKFPTTHALSKAPLKEVLSLWQGLGYNRRAKFLHGAATYIEEKGIPEDLTLLPGVGRYTAGALTAFVYNKDAIVVETNIRTAVMHHFFPKRKKVSDRELEGVLKKALPKGNARIFYSALMDYGAQLKRSGVRTNHKQKGYRPQSAFKGSRREVRGAVIRALQRGTCSLSSLQALVSPSRSEEVRTIVEDLLKEGLIQRKKGRYSL